MDSKGDQILGIQIFNFFFCCFVLVFGFEVVFFFFVCLVGCLF